MAIKTAKKTVKKREKKVSFSLRAHKSTMDLIDRASALKDMDRTAFLIDVGRQHAEEVILNHPFTKLDDKSYKKFMRLLDDPMPHNDALTRTLSHKAPWET